MDDILEYENLVRKIISKYNYYGDYEDLYQVGMMGLMKALKNYKYEGAKFSTYAYQYIIGEVTTFIRENNPVKISKDIVRLSKVIDRCREVLYQKLGRTPTDLEVSLMTEISEEKIAEIKEVMQQVESLDYVNEENSESVYNSISVDDHNLDSSYLDLKNELNNLEQEERDLIYKRYYEGYTQSELSKSLGMSQVQISRKENKVLEKLKIKL